MYDYISLYSDEMYSGKIRTEVLEEYLVSTLHFTKDSNLKFSKDMNGETIRITGVMANSNGNYAFDSLDGVEEINLIEIVIPENINDDLEEKVSKMASAIAKEYSSVVDER